VILGRRFRRCGGRCAWMALRRSRGSASCYNYWIDGAQSPMRSHIQSYMKIC
jgi:hypothetical protein